jgi:hypothetical protein
MGNNCTAYCAGCQDDESGNRIDKDQFSQAVKRGEKVETIREDHYYINQAKGMQNLSSPGATSDIQTNDPVDQRVRKPALTLKNGAVYTGEWMNGKRDGYGS